MRWPPKDLLQLEQWYQNAVQSAWEEEPDDKKRDLVLLKIAQVYSKYLERFKDDAFSSICSSQN